MPYPRIQFPVVSYAPFYAKDKVNHKLNSFQELTEACFTEENFMAKINLEHGKFMSCFLLARGDVTSSEVNTAIQYIKTNKGG